MKKSYFVLFFALSCLFLFSCSKTASSGGEEMVGTKVDPETATESKATDHTEEPVEMTVPPAAPEFVSHQDDFEVIKAAFLERDTETLRFYTDLDGDQTADALMSMMEGEFLDVLKGTKYGDIEDTERDGLKLKSFMANVTFGEEGEDTMESMIMIDFEKQEKRLMIISYMMAG